jgi:hypothetical protein
MARTGAAEGGAKRRRSRSPLRGRQPLSVTMTRSTRPPPRDVTLDEEEDRRIERRKLVDRWQPFADTHAPIEQRRFQVLVVARLHA